MRKQIVVIGDSTASQKAKKAAFETGRIIAELGAVLVSGGRGGVMEAAGRGAREAGGLVLSIIPDDSFSRANACSDLVIPTGIGFARNMINVLSGHAVVVIGGGSGTLSELAYAWQFGKPILALSWIKGAGSIYAGKTLDNRRKDAIIPIEDFTILAEKLQEVLTD